MSNEIVFCKLKAEVWKHGNVLYNEVRWVKKQVVIQVSQTWKRKTNIITQLPTTVYRTTSCFDFDPQYSTRDYGKEA